MPYENISGSVIERKKIIDLTDKLDKNGILSWDVPSGNWSIMRFGTRNNGAVTRPAPMPGLGFECDKFDTTAFNAHYEAFNGKLIDISRPGKTRSGGGWTMIHIDSWEMGAQKLESAFQGGIHERRGYDLWPYLPSYAGLVVDSREITERFLWDLRKTSSELIVENHAEHYKKLGQKTALRYQSNHMK